MFDVSLLNGLKFTITMLETMKYHFIKSEFSKGYLYLAVAVITRVVTERKEFNIALNE